MKTNVFLTILCVASGGLAFFYVRTHFELQSIRGELQLRQSLSNPELTAMRGWGIVAQAYCGTYCQSSEIVTILSKSRLSCAELLPHLKSKTPLNPLGIDFSRRTMISRETWRRIEEFSQILPGSESILGGLIISNHSKNNNVGGEKDDNMPGIKKEKDSK